MLNYGKVITEEGYRNGSVYHRLRRTEESIAVDNRQQLFDQILTQLTKLDTCDEITFTVHADQETRQPTRIVVVNEEKL